MARTASLDGPYTKGERRFCRVIEATHSLAISPRLASSDVTLTILATLGYPCRMRTAWLALIALVGCGERTSVLGSREGFIDGTCTGHPGNPRVLVYTYENQWRHVSNLTARAAILGMCTTRGFTVSSTNDMFAINATQLAQFDVVVFGVTSGIGLDDQAHKD